MIRIGNETYKALRHIEGNGAYFKDIESLGAEYSHRGYGLQKHTVNVRLICRGDLFRVPATWEKNKVDLVLESEPNETITFNGYRLMHSHIQHPNVFLTFEWIP